jgi:hypothetical protein
VAVHQQVEGGVAEAEVDVGVPAAAHVVDRVVGVRQIVLLGQVDVEGVDGQGREEAVLVAGRPRPVGGHPSRQALSRA